MLTASQPLVPGSLAPLDTELELLRRWRRRSARATTAGWVVLVLILAALLGWGLATPTWRALVADDQSPVEVTVVGMERIGSCMGRTQAVNRYRYDVVVTDPGASGMPVGAPSAVEECRLHRTGAHLDVNAVDGTLTSHDSGWARWLVVITAGFGLFFAGLLWVFRRAAVRVDRLVDGHGEQVVVEARLGTGRLAWSADFGTGVLHLGLPLITTDQRLLRWRWRSVPRSQSPVVTLLLLGSPRRGDPALVVDAAGSRHWRTLN